MTPDVRGVQSPANQLSTVKTSGMTQLLQTLGKLGASSPSTAIKAEVRQVQPEGNGFRVTLTLNGQSMTVPSPSRPGNPLNLYVMNGAVHVAALPNRRTNTAPPAPTPHLATLLQGLGSPQPATAALLQTALSDPAMAGWASVLAQLTNPEFTKRWVGDRDKFEAMMMKLAESMIERGTKQLAEPYIQQQEQRAVAGQEDSRQGLPTWRFDVPIQLGNRWVDGQATLQRKGAQGDVWDCLLPFELPKSGRVDARVRLAPQAIETTFRAERPAVLRRLGELTEPMAARLRQMGLPMQPIALAPWVKPAPPPAPEGKGGGLDIRV